MRKNMPDRAFPIPPTNPYKKEAPMQTNTTLPAPLTPAVKFTANVFERAALLGSVVQDPNEILAVGRAELIQINPTVTIVRLFLYSTDVDRYRYLEYVTNYSQLNTPLLESELLTRYTGSLQAYTIYVNACKLARTSDLHYFEEREQIIPQDTETLDIVLGLEESGLGAPVLYLDELGQERPYSRIGFDAFEPPLNVSAVSIYPDGNRYENRVYYAAYQSDVDFLSVNTVVTTNSNSVTCYFCAGIDVTGEVSFPYNVPFNQ
jgi:hypothetical protein